MADACILGPMALTKMAMEGGKELSFQRDANLLTGALEAA
jgi:hypothetical protein